MSIFNTCLAVSMGMEDTTPPAPTVLDKQIGTFGNFILLSCIAAKAQALEKVYMTDGLNLHKRVALLMLRDKIRQHRVEKLVVGEHSVNMFAFYNTLTYCDASDREYPVDMFMIVGPHGLNQEELEHTVSCYCKRELLHFETVGTKGPYVDYDSNEDAYYFFIEKRGMAQFRKTNIDQLVSLFK